MTVPDETQGERMPETPTAEEAVTDVRIASIPEAPTLEDSYLSFAGLSPDLIRLKHDFGRFVSTQLNPNLSKDAFDFSNVKELGDAICQYLTFLAMSLDYKHGKGAADGRPHRDTMEACAVQLLHIVSVSIFLFYHPLYMARRLDPEGLCKFEVASTRIFSGHPRWEEGLDFLVADHLTSIYRHFCL
jgi:hypothetical protein